MEDSLIVNPFTHLFATDQDCHLVSPKPGSGLISIYFSLATHPNLFELFLDLSKLRLDFLDVENDLNDEERNLLFDAGVLVVEKDAPQQPLFSCQFSDVEPVKYDADHSSLIVNPHFRFEPLDLGSFNSFAQDQGLLPYQPSAWIRTYFTKIEIGYWLHEGTATILSKLEAGKPPSTDIIEDLINRMLAAEILISPREVELEKVAFQNRIKRAQTEFTNNKFVVLHDLLPEPQMKAMRNYYKEYVKNGFMPFSDGQVEKRYYQHNEPLATFLHGNLTKLMNLVAGKSVKPSYVYAASYEEDAILKPHTDRPQCEFSFSFQVDYSPAQENNQSPWGLFLDNPDPQYDPASGDHNEDLPAKDQSEDNNCAVYLASGDAVAYKGCDLIHYRYPLPKGHKSTSLFFHYVPIDFDGTLS